MKRLRMGMVGGGPGSFIGPVHRLAAEMDREIELVAGAFSSQAERCAEASKLYRIDPARSYRHWDEMFAAEAAREDGIDFVVIVTPNHLHLPVGLAAVRAGIPVLSDKPMTAIYQEAKQLSEAVEENKVPYRLTYTYSGYPLVREARALVRDGAIGEIRKVVVEYMQGWLAEPIEHNGSKQAAWRTDPKQSGEGGCIGDIGVHAFHLAEFITGLRVEKIKAELNIVVPGRRLDDDCTVLLRFENGAPGVLMASQIATGDRNAIRVRVYGTQGGLDWWQERPNTLTINRNDGSSEIRHAGSLLLGPDARASIRLPMGHPEGYLEAFGNIYRDFAQLLRGEGAAPLVPGIIDGLRGMRFVSAALANHAQASGWTQITGADET